MTNHDFISLKAEDGTELDAYIARPDGGLNNHTGLLLFQEAYGVNHHIRSVADRLCKEGYAVIAPDLFHRTAKRIEIPYSDFQAAMPHFQAVKFDGLKADAKACYDWLQKELGLENIASMGFCLGGRVAFIANACLPLKAGISYYGGGLETLASEAKNLSGSHLFFWGGKDEHITPEKVDTIVNSVKSAGKDYVSTVFSTAWHAFNSDERSTYQHDAASEAWSFALAFLKNKLK